jgi:hypothetical protein
VAVAVPSRQLLHLAQGALSLVARRNQMRALSLVSRVVVEVVRLVMVPLVLLQLQALEGQALPQRSPERRRYSGLAGLVADALVEP